MKKAELISLGRWRDDGKQRAALAVNGSLSLSLSVSVCCPYYSRLMGTGVNVAQKGAVLWRGGGLVCVWRGALKWRNRKH